MHTLYPVFAALIFNALDLISGIIAAVRNKDVKSQKLRDGLFKKFGFIICYFLAWLIDNEGAVIGFQIGVKVLPIIVLYCCTTETVSIIENICRINPDLVPEKLKELFHITELKDDQK